MRISARTASALIIAMVTLASLPESAWAQGRYTTLIDEFVDGAKQSTSSAELALVKTLMTGGVHFVDEAQSRKIRSVTDAGQLLAGTVSPVITSLDADVIIAGLCHLDVLKSDLLGPNTHRYDASLEAKAISVATGQVLGVFQARGQAMAFIPRQAAQKAAEIAAQKLSTQILAMTKKALAPPTVELTISGIPDLRSGERAREAISKLPGLSTLSVAQASRGVSKFILTSSGPSARELALEIDAMEDLGVVVIGYNDRAIKAEFRAEAAMALDILIGRFDNTSKQKRDSWMQSGLAEIVGTSLSNLSFLSFAEQGKAMTLGAKAKSWKKALKRAKADPKKSVVLTGSLTRKGQTLAIKAAIRAAKTGSVVLAAQKSCDSAEVSACAEALAEELSEGLLANIQKKRHLFSSSLAKVDPKALQRSDKPLKISRIEADNLFPTRLGAYATQGIGALIVENTGDAAITAGVLSANLPGYTKSPVDTRFDAIAPGAKATIPIRLVLDTGALIDHRENQPAVLTLSLTYEADDFTLVDTRSKALVVYNRNAVSWTKPSSIAAFVTPQSDHVQTLAREVAALLPKAQKAHPLGKPAALFSALTSQGLTYVKDPVNPHAGEALDYVQFPEQTLDAKAGDCDDLAVLYVALSEAMGHRAVLVTTPGHIFAALSTGLPVQSAATLSFDESALLRHEGALWVPVETTLVDKDLSAAWKAGATELARWSDEPDKVQVIDIRRAWATYPPVNLSERARSVRTMTPDVLTRALTAALKDADQARSSWLQSKMSALDKALKRAGEDAKTLHEKAQLLYHQGKHDEARVLFKRASKDPALKKEAMNNLANLALVGGEAADALKTYKRAAALDPQDARIQLNAAMAAFAAGDEDAFGEHIFMSIDLGAEDAVNRLSQSGVMSSSETTGSDASGLAMRELEEAVKKAFKRAGRTMTYAPNTVASDAAEAKVPIERYLHWL